MEKLASYVVIKSHITKTARTQAYLIKTTACMANAGSILTGYNSYHFRKK